MLHRRFDLTGRVAIVTGGGRGLGRGIALALAGAGAVVVVADRALAGAAETAAMACGDGLSCRAAELEATSVEQCPRLVGETAAQHGRLDIMVVSHGVNQLGPAAEIDPAAWDSTISVNLGGVFWAAQAAGRQMLQQPGGGSIVLISSTASLVGFENLAAYGASKGGVDQLCRQLAVEWGPGRVRVNAVNPGYTENEMEGARGRHAAAGLSDEVRRLTPLGRRATVAEIAGPVLFLASDAASFVTGVCLPVDGGYCAR